LALRANLACLSFDSMLLGQHAVLTLPVLVFTFAQAVGRFALLHLSTFSFPRANPTNQSPLPPYSVIRTP